MGIIGWIILGLLAGAIAKVILPGDDPGGIIVTMLIGIAGAIIGGLIASALSLGDLGDFLRHRHLDHRHPGVARSFVRKTGLGSRCAFGRVERPVGAAVV